MFLQSRLGLGWKSIRNLSSRTLSCNPDIGENLRFFGKKLVQESIYHLKSQKSQSASTELNYVLVLGLIIPSTDKMKC